MANTPNKTLTADPELKDLINLAKKDTLVSINCHHIGQIQTFNPTNQTATVTINYTKTYMQFNSLTGQYDAVPRSYPLLADCPVICLGGGPGALTFPIRVGDECLVLFNDRDIDNWFTSGGTGSEVNTSRLHSFSDAIILVGVRSIPNALTDYSMTATELLYNGNVVSINDTRCKIDLVSGVSLEIDATGKLKITNGVGELIASLINMIETAFTVTLLGNQPLVLNPALQTIVDSFK